MELDKALAQLKQPDRLGEIVNGLPCDLCGKPHTKVIAVKIEGCLVWEIHSFCLDEIARRAVARIG